MDGLTSVSPGVLISTRQVTTQKRERKKTQNRKRRVQPQSFINADGKNNSGSRSFQIQDAVGTAGMADDLEEVKA